MIDWEEILNSDDKDELKEIKIWLFKENIRLQNEKKELEEARDNFLSEKNRFRTEMEALNQKSSMERQKLREESVFFDKKMQILQDGFKQLDLDRKHFEEERRYFLEKQSSTTTNSADVNSKIAVTLFKNVNNPMAARKRYRDLVKIFHPDNVCGDEALMIEINKEFEKKKQY